MENDQTETKALPSKIYYIFDLLMLALELDKAVLGEFAWLALRSGLSREHWEDVLLEFITRILPSLVAGTIIALAVNFWFGTGWWTLVLVCALTLSAQCLHLHLDINRLIRQDEPEKS